MKTLSVFFQEFTQWLFSFWAKNEQARNERIEDIKNRLSKYTSKHLSMLCGEKGDLLVDGTTDLLNIARDFCKISNPQFRKFNRVLFIHQKDIRSLVEDFSKTKPFLSIADVNDSYEYLCFCVYDVKGFIEKALDLEASEVKYDYAPERMRLPESRKFYKNIRYICEKINSGERVFALRQF